MTSLSPYRTPGVHFEWLSPPRGVQLIRTDIAGFVGVAARGPLLEPTRVSSWTEFTGRFGGCLEHGYLAYALRAFFANGGLDCWVVRVADRAAARAGSVVLGDERGRPALRLTAASPGTWSQRTLVTSTRLGAGRFSLLVDLPGEGQERWPQLSVEPGAPRHLEAVLNDPVSGSRLLRAEQLGARLGVPRDTLVTLGEPEGRGGALGRDGLDTLSPAHLREGLARLAEVDEVSILAAPDLVYAARVPPPARPPRPTPVTDCERLDEPAASPPTGPPPAEERRPVFDPDQLLELQFEMVKQCEQLKDRVALLDTPAAATTAEQVGRWRAEFDTSYAALSFPWLQVPDPLGPAGQLRTIPPSGHLAGVCARVDRERGVHKPPANEVVEDVLDVAVAVDDAGHGDLNTAAVNTIRALPGRGIRVLGARTLSSDLAWRFLNVRRLLLMIEESIETSVQWTVFEPGGPALWRVLDRAARSFLEGIWQVGMLDGATAGDAFFVTCDETTNPPEEAELGRVVCEIGVQPPWPAEFVVVRIGRTEGGQELLELGEGGHG